jgi:hypothetical protein
VENPDKNDTFALELSDYRAKYRTSFLDVVCFLLVAFTEMHHYGSEFYMKEPRYLILNPPYRGE